MDCFGLTEEEKNQLFQFPNGTTNLDKKTKESQKKKKKKSNEEEQYRSSRLGSDSEHENDYDDFMMPPPQGIQSPLSNYGRPLGRGTPFYPNKSNEVAAENRKLAFIGKMEYEIRPLNEETGGSIYRNEEIERQWRNSQENQNVLKNVTNSSVFKRSSEEDFIKKTETIIKKPEARVESIQKCPALPPETTLVLRINPDSNSSSTSGDNAEGKPHKPPISYKNILVATNKKMEDDKTKTGVKESQQLYIPPHLRNRRKEQLQKATVEAETNLTNGIEKMKIKKPVKKSVEELCKKNVLLSKLYKNQRAQSASPSSLKESNRNSELESSCDDLSECATSSSYLASNELSSSSVCSPVSPKLQSPKKVHSASSQISPQYVPRVTKQRSPRYQNQSYEEIQDSLVTFPDSELDKSLLLPKENSSTVDLQSILPPEFNSDYIIGDYDYSDFVKPQVTKQTNKMNKLNVNIPVRITSKPESLSQGLPKHPGPPSTPIWNHYYKTSHQDKDEYKYDADEFPSL